MSRKPTTRKFIDQGLVSTNPWEGHVFFQTLYGFNSTTVVSLAAHSAKSPPQRSSSLETRHFAKVVRDAPYLTLRRLTLFVENANSTYSPFLAEVDLHFLRTRTIASYNDLAWHNFASFIYFMFLFCSIPDPYQQTVSKVSKTLPLSFLDDSPVPLSISQNLHTLLFDCSAQLRTSRPRVDKQLLIFRNNWFLRKYC